MLCQKSCRRMGGAVRVGRRVTSEGRWDKSHPIPLSSQQAPKRYLAKSWYFWSFCPRTFVNGSNKTFKQKDARRGQPTVIAWSWFLVDWRRVRRTPLEWTQSLSQAREDGARGVGWSCCYCGQIGSTYKLVSTYKRTYKRIHECTYKFGSTDECT